MIESLGGVTGEIARLALDVAVRRHELAAHNIANADTPGFVPKRLDFAERLRMLVSDFASGLGASDIESRVSELRAQLNDGSAVEAKIGQSVEVDQELVTITENVLYYRALLEGLVKRGDILRSAIRERGI